jgi:N-acetylglutamate synthase
MIKIRLMTIDDYEQLIELFQQTPGIAVREADSKNAINKYLDRNKNLNFVATDNNKIIGCVMCGYDGRRGYLQHLIVKPEYRRKGIGENLFKNCIRNLDKIGISKTQIFVFKDNDIANKFWSNKGWKLREDVNMYSYISSKNENA